MSRRVALITLVAAICGLALAVEAPSRDSRYGYTIFVVNADGTARRNLTSGTPARLVLGALSPDGRTLAYQRRRVEGGSDLWSIEVMPARGGAARTLVRLSGASAYAPAWSRDGKLIAFETCCSHRGIGVVRPDGARLSTIPGASNPAWLPGARLAFLAGGDLKTEIATANPDGSERRSVLNARPFEEFGGLAAAPNGQTFAFHLILGRRRLAVFGRPRRYPTQPDRERQVGVLVVADEPPSRLRESPGAGDSPSRRHQAPTVPSDANPEPSGSGVVA